MQKNTNIDKKIPVTMRVTGYFQNIKVLNSGGGMVLAVGGLIAMYVIKKRRDEEGGYEYDEDEYEDE